MLTQSIFALGIIASFAQSGPDLKAVKFSGEIVSQTPYKLKFQPPKGHHFNQEAPTKVEIQNEGQTQSGKIDKSLQLITVDFGKDMKLGANCSVKAQLYVCNDDNTYCLPIKQEYDCKKLQLKVK